MNAQTLRSLAPELYMIAGVLFYWVSTANVFNPIAIVLLIILGWQVYTQKFTSGILIASVFLLLNLYMVLALVSELSEFTSATSSFYQLLIVGSLFLGGNLLASFFMILKYVKTQVVPFR